MKKPLVFVIAGSLLWFTNSNHVNAQNLVNISGNTCTGSTLSASISGTQPEKIEWKLNGYVINVSGSTRQGVTVAGGNGPGNQANQLYYPNGVFVDKDDNIWVADASNGRVQKFTPGNPNAVTIGGSLPNHPTFPVNVFVCPDGAIYVADYFEGRVKRLAKGGTKWITVAGQHDELDLVRGVWVDKHGNVYCTQYGFYFNGTVKLDGMVLKYPPHSSNWQIVAGGNGIGNALNQFSQPTSVMLDDEGSMYVADSRNDHGQENARVMKWTQGATQGEVVAGGNGVGNQSNQCPYPFHAFVDKQKNVFVSNTDVYSKITKWLPVIENSEIIAGGNGVGDDARSVYTGQAAFFLRANTFMWWMRLTTGFKDSI
jgi:sugar lactone lactonase YvrE